MSTSIQTRPIVSEAEDRKVKRAAKVIRALNHPLRKSLLETIESYGNNMTVTEIYVKLRLEQSVASQHLAILRDADMVSTRRDGKKIYYSVNHPKIEDVVYQCSNF